jgi:hypothetical protein
VQSSVEAGRIPGSGAELGFVLRRRLVLGHHGLLGRMTRAQNTRPRSTERHLPRLDQPCPRVVAHHPGSLGMLQCARRQKMSQIRCWEHGPGACSSA